MNPIFKKLNFKDQSSAFVVNAPDSFNTAMNEMKLLTSVKTTLVGAKDVSFFLGFVMRQNEVDELAKKVSKLLTDDGTLWFAYPKGTSRKYTCEFNRDNGWAELGKLGFEPVRMVAIDQDWSALRFRNPDHIKTMTRSSALSKKGTKKIQAAKKAKK